jgi:predicted Zn-dependent protease
MLGLCEFEVHEDDAALRNLLAAEKLGIVKDQKLRIVALYHLGLLELRAGKYGGARETFSHLARDRIRTPELINGLGQAALLIKPQDAPAGGTPGATVVEGVGEAELLLNASEFDQAKQKYTQLVADFPDYPNLHFAYGRVLLEMHDNESAVQQFQRELQRDPRHVNAMLEIAVADQMLDPQTGLKYAEDALKLAPTLPFAHYMVGMLRLETGDAQGSVQELEIARKAFPKEAGVYFALGKAYSRIGRKEDAAKARAEFARLNALAPKPSGVEPSGVSTRLSADQP